MRQLIWLTVAAVLAFAGAASAQVPVVGEGNATLNDIVGTETMVTVVLKEGDAEDPNQRVADLYEKYFAVLSSDGMRNYYRYEDVKELRIQGGKVEVKKIERHPSLSLTAAQRTIAERAAERVVEVFKRSNENQPLKMDAAAIMMVGGDENTAQEASEYLLSLASSNDVPVALDAGMRLYLAGEPLPPELLLEGVEHSNPRVRCEAAQLAGLAGDHVADSLILRLVQDRSPEYSAPAARAAAMLDLREALPSIYAMLVQPNDRKGDAAVFALVTMGGDEIKNRLRRMLDETEGIARFRVAKALDRLGDSTARKVLRDEMLQSPSLKMKTAILLAPSGDIKALQILRERVNRRTDPLLEVLMWRARAAAALFAAQDRSMHGTLMELTQSEFPEVRKEVYKVMAEAGERALLPIAQPGLEDENDEVVLEAARATLALVNPAFRDRLLASRE